MNKSDAEFYQLISNFNSVFKVFKNENKRLNFHVYEKKLFYIKKANIYHLIGMHHISIVLGYSEKKQDDIEKIIRFVDDILNGKLNYYKLQQSFIKNIKLLKINDNLKKRPVEFCKLIAQRIATFVEICTKDFKNQEEIIITKLPSEDITYLCIKEFSKNRYGSIGFKDITGENYEYNTYVSQTIKTLNIKRQTFKTEKFNYKTIYLKTK